MEKKSPLKYYLLGGAIILVVVVVAIVLSQGNSKSTGQNTQTADSGSTQITSTVPPATTVTTSVENSSPVSSDSLIGTWVSSVQGKGLQGSGKITNEGTTTQVNLVGDVSLVVKGVENNTATGTITFSKVCLTTIVSVPGKPDVTKPAECLGAYSQPSVMQISGNTIKYSGKSLLGASISLTGTYTSDSMSGIFTRTSSNGNINGTFNLVRSKK